MLSLTLQNTNHSKILFIPPLLARNEASTALSSPLHLRTAWVGTNISNRPITPPTLPSSSPPEAHNKRPRRRKKPIPLPSQHPAHPCRNHDQRLRRQHYFAHLDPYRRKLWFRNTGHFESRRCNSRCRWTGRGEGSRWFYRTSRFRRVRFVRVCDWFVWIFASDWLSLSTPGLRHNSLVLVIWHPMI